MKLKILFILKKYYPILGLFLLVCLLFIFNYSSNTYLTGWDNLHPEFGFGINIKRSFFAVWQEYQSLGLLGGMGHASDLFRQIFLLIASVIIPNHLLRYFSTFLMLFIGSAGAYFLINYVLKNIKHENKLVAFMGSVFYLLNISTIQVFYVPFEAFIAHYAFLPWVILFSIKFLQKPNKKSALFVFIVFLLTSPQAYIPTLFVSSLLAITIVSIPLFFGNFKKTFISYIKLLILIFLANSFWLIPFIFFTFSQVSVTLDSKINQMATEPIFLQNKEHGDLLNVAMLKGYLFSNVEPDINGKFDYILKSWRQSFNNPLVIISSLFLFFIILIGGIKATMLKNKLGISFVLLFIFGFTMLATNFPPFSIINDLLRDHIPLFNQAFRFPYTKFLTIADLSYSVLLAIGVTWIIGFIKNKNLKKLLPSLIIVLIILLSLSAFRGNLLYFKETLKIPDEYFQTFEFFKNQNPNTRIANFPQYTFWGWNFYNWGYSGSGFLWYGIEQPILDRTFDVWSPESENYYWEISQALYSKDPILFENVLNKYDINYILVDKNVISPVSAKSLYINELENIIAVLPSVTKLKDIGNIEIYTVALKNKPDNFISSLPKLNASNSYNWSGLDQTYSESGDYSNDKDISIYYPFRSLFSSRNELNKSFMISENNDYFEFSSKLPPKNINTQLNTPSLANNASSIPINIVAKKSGNTLSIHLELKNPEIYIKTGSKINKIWENKVYKNLFSNLNYNSKPLYLNINGIANYKIADLKDEEEKIIGKSSLIFNENNVFVLSGNGNRIDTAKFNGAEIKELFTQTESFINLNKIPKDSYIILRIPKSNDNYSNRIIDPVEEINSKRAEVNNCDNFRKQYFAYFIKEDEAKKLLELSSKNATPCIAFYIPTLDHDQAYLVGINHKNIKDQSLHFWVLNEDGKFPVLDKYLEKTKNQNVSYSIIPPLEKFGKAYSFHFENISVGPNNSRNQLGKIKISDIPYYFISGINLKDSNRTATVYQNPKLFIKHPNQSLYMVEADNSKGNIAIGLSQSYSPYWKAYKVSNFNVLTQSFPFIFGKEIKKHLKINNWKNGWIIDKTSNNNNQSSIIIAYLPQYLQYLGFALTSGTLIFLIYLYLKDIKKTQSLT
jgi:hypothetical protein